MKTSLSVGTCGLRGPHEAHETGTCRADATGAVGTAHACVQGGAGRPSSAGIGWVLVVLGWGWLFGADRCAGEASFQGAYFAGEGDVEHVQLLDVARRMFDPDPEFQNLAMLYMPSWNGWVEGPTWGAWWVQNSYGTTYCALPFLEEPFVTFLQNSQDLWFDKMGDGRTSYVWNGKDSWVPPDGCLMDAASDTWAIHRQGDGRVGIHDWGIEFTAAGGVLQSELLLVGRDMAAIGRYLPRLERCADFVESRRDSKNDLFLVGPAGNLLAPSYAGYRRSDGTYGMAYLAGVSVTYVAFLDRLIELEKMVGRTRLAEELGRRRSAAREGLKRLTTAEGYLVKSMDPDGTLHGVHGAERHGYFEASPNHDAICFRVVDDAQAGGIYRRMAAIPGLRPHGLIVANCPSLDDMYEEPRGLWAFGTWVNGGHWTTCEARMMMAYYRVGAFADARRSMRQILGFARQFRLDNPLVDFGGAVYQPREPINLTYDAFGAPAGFVRGLFEYLYRADGLTLVPHLPDGVSRLEQRFPVRFGSKRLYLAVSGHGPIRDVLVNGRRWSSFDASSVFLPYDAMPESAAIEIVAGDAPSWRWRVPTRDLTAPEIPEAPAAPEGTPEAVILPVDLPFRIGADSDGGSRLKADVARVAVFRRALSVDEVASLSREVPGSLFQDPDVVGNWNLGASTNGWVENRSGPAPGARWRGRVEIVDSRFGPVLRFGGDGFLEVTNHPALNLSQGGTWYMLLNPGETQGRLIDKCPVGGATGYTFDTHPGNSLRLITDAGTVAADVRLRVGEWIHVAATVDAHGDATLYVDGRPVVSKAGTPGGVDVAALTRRVERIRRFAESMRKEGMADTYEAAHARLVVRCLAAAFERSQAVKAGRWARLPERSQIAADRLYLTTTARLVEGLTRILEAERGSEGDRRKRLGELWRASAGGPR